MIGCSRCDARFASEGIMQLCQTWAGIAPLCFGGNKCNHVQTLDWLLKVGCGVCIATSFALYDTECSHFYEEALVSDDRIPSLQRSVPENTTSERSILRESVGHQKSGCCRSGSAMHTMYGANTPQPSGVVCLCSVSLSTPTPAVLCTRTVVHSSHRFFFERDLASIPLTESSSSSAPIDKMSYTQPSTEAPSAATKINSPPIQCIYNATADMYGLGVRTGFYIQSFFNILGGLIPHSSGFGRGTSAVMTFALIVAYALGFEDPLDEPQLEIQLFLPLVTMISIPLSLLVFLRGHLPQGFYSLGSLVSLSALFVVACILGLVGVARKRYNGPCPLVSGIGAYDQKSKGLWLGSIFILGTATCVGVVLLWYSSWRFLRSFKRQEWRTNKRGIMIRLKYIAWTLTVLAIWITCVLSVELTIARHNVVTEALAMEDFGQWLSLCVGVASVIKFGWNMAEYRSKRRREAVTGIEMTPFQNEEDNTHMGTRRRIEEPEERDISNTPSQPSAQVSSPAPSQRPCQPPEQPPSQPHIQPLVPPGTQSPSQVPSQPPSQPPNQSPARPPAQPPIQTLHQLQVERNSARSISSTAGTNSDISNRDQEPTRPAGGRVTVRRVTL